MYNLKTMKEGASVDNQQRLWRTKYLAKKSLGLGPRLRQTILEQHQKSILGTHS